MTRKEEIEKAAQKNEWISKSLNLQSAFIEGVKWADENPQMRKDYEFLFMLKKQELIKKACEWMKANIKPDTVSYNDVWDQSDVNILMTDFTTVDEMIENFKKAMEE